MRGLRLYSTQLRTTKFCEEAHELLESVTAPEAFSNKRKPFSKEIEMTEFKWLHLSDFHCGAQGHDSFWPRTQEGFLEDLTALHKLSGPWDFIFFTGDLTWKGTADEFDQVAQFLSDLREQLNQLGSRPLFFCVPGNHDLVRPAPSSRVLADLQAWIHQPKIQETFWSDDVSTYRQLVNEVFNNYISRLNTDFRYPAGACQGMLPGDFSYTFTKNQAQLGILGLNSSFLQLSNGDYEGKLALHVDQFHRACGGNGPLWAKQHHLCLLLTHHPPEWLLSESREIHYRDQIAPSGQFAAHLFGHMHEHRYTSQQEGGALARNYWQGISLFSLEPYYNQAGEHKERLHGYSAGCLTMTDRETASLTFWPRKAECGQDGVFRIHADTSFKLDHTNQCTVPITVKLLRDFDGIIGGEQGMSENNKGLNQSLKIGKLNTNCLAVTNAERSENDQHNGLKQKIEIDEVTVSEGVEITNYKDRK